MPQVSDSWLAATFGERPPGLTRRRFLLAGLALSAAAAVPGLAAKVALACDSGNCYQVGWTCAWTGWGYRWMSMTDCFDSVTGDFCGEYWIDTGVPC